MNRLMLGTVIFGVLLFAGCSQRSEPQKASEEVEPTPEQQQSLKEQQYELDRLARPYEIDLRTEQ